MCSKFYTLEFTREIKYNTNQLVSLKPTTFHPTEPCGAHGNSGEKMPKDDVFSEQKPLYVVEIIRNYLYVAVRDAEAVGSSPIASTKKSLFFGTRIFYSNR